MMSDDAKELMEEMPANVVKRLIAIISPITASASLRSRYLSATVPTRVL